MMHVHTTAGHSGFREWKIRTGQLHYIPCYLPPGVTKSTLDFYLNDDTCPLDINGDSNLVVGGTRLEIKSVGPAYEGRYYCRFNDFDPELVQCVYVLGEYLFASSNARKLLGEGGGTNTRHVHTLLYFLIVLAIGWHAFKLNYFIVK